jgi:hypothetical protein
VVFVAPSDGLARLFEDNTEGLREFVAVRVVRRGQGANPSTGELLEAIADTPADELLVLPNNPNVILAARQVAAMADRPVHVVPTRNAPRVRLAGRARRLRRRGERRAMTEESREVQTMQVTEAVRDATVSGRKVKKGQTIALDPDDGLLAVDNDPLQGGARRDDAPRPGLSLVTIYYGEERRIGGFRVARPQDRRGGAGAGGGPGAPRRPAPLSVPDRGRVSDGERSRSAAPRGGRSLRPRAVAAIPADPVARLELPLGLSGLSAASVLRRTGRRLGLGTVRDLLFHLPRRYDDLRELRRLGDLHAVADGTVVSARVRVTDVRVQQTWRRRVQVTTAFLADDTGIAEATWFGRRFIERRVRAGDELIVSGKLKRRLRPSCSRARSSSLPTPRTCSTWAASCPCTGSPPVSRPTASAARCARHWTGRAMPTRSTCRPRSPRARRSRP